jgi:hypothetical protein
VAGLRRGSRVLTQDGPGRVVGRDTRANTNGGPGTRQWVVRLDRSWAVRHYNTTSVKPLPDARRTAPAPRGRRTATSAPARRRP